MTKKSGTKPKVKSQKAVNEMADMKLTSIVHEIIKDEKGSYHWILVERIKRISK